MWIPILFAAGLMGLVLLVVIIWAILELDLQKRFQRWLQRKTANQVPITHLVWLSALIFPIVVFLGFWVFSSLELELWQVVRFLSPL